MNSSRLVDVFELVGTAEIADELGVTTQRLHQIRASDRLGFPEPVTTLTCGKIWVRSDINAWARTWRRKPGRPGKREREERAIAMAKTFRFRGKYVNDTGVVVLGRYSDDSIAILLKSSWGEEILKPTVNLRAYGETPAEGNVFIKTYGDAEGILESLQENRIVGPTIRTIKYGEGDAGAVECELIIDPDDTAIFT